VLWYAYAAPTSLYRQQILELAANAPNYPQSAGAQWNVIFFGPGDPTPDFSAYNVLVIESGEAFRTGATPSEADLAPDYAGILANKAAIAAARGERTLISGSDADFHAVRGDSGNCSPATGCNQYDGAIGYVVNAVNWAGGGAGLGILSFYDGEFSGSFWWNNAQSFLKDELAGKVSNFRDNGAVIAPQTQDLPLNRGLTSAGLSNWRNSFHANFLPDTPGYLGLQNAGGQPGRVLTLATAAFAAAPAGPAPLIEFQSADYSVNEQGAGVDVVVTRADNQLGAISADYTTRNGTAVSTADYTLTAGTVSFADGDTGPKTIRVPITDDAASEGVETFTVELSNASGGAKIGARNAATITIEDNDSGGGGGRGGGGSGGGCAVSTVRSADWSLLLLISWAAGSVLRRGQGRRR
jgi:hypothetical protein